DTRSLHVSGQELMQQGAGAISVESNATTCYCSVHTSSTNGRFRVTVRLLNGSCIGQWMAGRNRDCPGLEPVSSCPMAGGTLDRCHSPAQPANTVRHAHHLGSLSWRILGLVSKLATVGHDRTFLLRVLHQFRARGCARKNHPHLPT